MTVLYIMTSEAATKTRILQAALACAQEKRGLTMAAVAAGAGLSRQAIYLHFADRPALLAGLAAQLGPTDPLEAVAKAPSARAAVAALTARLAEDYARLRPVAGILEDSAQQSWQRARLGACRQIAARFQTEGALSRHLSADTASDLLWSLTSRGIWEDLVTGRGWTAERTRSHVTYLAVSAVTK